MRLPGSLRPCHTQAMQPCTHLAPAVVAPPLAAAVQDLDHVSILPVLHAHPGLAVVARALQRASVACRAAVVVGPLSVCRTRHCTSFVAPHRRLPAPHITRASRNLGALARPPSPTNLSHNGPAFSKRERQTRRCPGAPPPLSLSHTHTPRHSLPARRALARRIPP
jgi:hypothetical protein